MIFGNVTAPQSMCPAVLGTERQSSRLSWRPYVENRGNKAYACLQSTATKTFTLASGRGP
jgi:hypothetical protein